MSKLNSKQSALVYSKSDITLWISGFGAGTSYALAKKILASGNDVVYLNPVHHHLRFTTIVEHLGDSVANLNSVTNKISLKSGHNVSVIRNVEQADGYNRSALLIVENLHLFDNSDYKKLVELIKKHEKVVLTTNVAEDKKSYSRRFALQASMSGCGFITFDGKYPVFSNESIDGFYWRTFTVVHTNVYDNTWLITNHPNYLASLKALSQQDQKKAFAVF